MKNLFIALFFIFAAQAANSQVSVTGNHRGAIGLNYEVFKSIDFGLRIEPGKLGASILTPVVIGTIKRYKDADVYLGIGIVGLYPVDVLSVPVGLRVYPMREKQLFAFTFEVEGRISDLYYIVPSIGIAYKFGKKQ